MKMYTLTSETYSEALNDAKNVLADGLFSDGVIDNETYRSIKEDYAIILAPSSMFGNAARKALGWDEEKDYYKVVKLKLNNNNKDKKDVHQSEDSDTEGVDNGSE